jgi:hypothetical protein
MVKAKRNKRRGVKKANRKINYPLYLTALNLEVFNANDLVLQYFIGYGKVNTKSIRDLYRNSNTEVNLRIDLINNNAPNAEQIGETLYSENDSLNIEDTDYRDAVLDVLNEYISRTDMANYLVKKYKVKATKIQAPELVECEYPF